MKKSKIFIGLFAWLLVFSACKNTSSSESSADVVPNIDDEVKACFEQVNLFRTGDEAFYWNSDDTTKTDLTGQLGTLTLDETLCKAAQIRSNEIVNNFAHTRPDGTSCFTVLKDVSVSYSGCGENIAAGNKTGVATFNQWKEDSCSYSGQGHRRNMLGNYTKIGIAYTYDAESTYKYYWTMILTR